MKLTTKQLKQIIKEELEIVLEGTLADIRPEDWIYIFNGCIEKGVPSLNIRSGDEDGCMNLAAQVQSGNYDYETVKAHLAYERDKTKALRAKTADRKTSDEEKDAIPELEEQIRRAEIKREWDQMEPSMKQRKAEHYINKANAQFWKIREKVVEIRRDLRNVDWDERQRSPRYYDDLERAFKEYEKPMHQANRVQIYFQESIAEMRLNEPLPDVVIDWIYKCRYEKESSYCT